MKGIKFHYHWLYSIGASFEPLLILLGLMSLEGSQAFKEIQYNGGHGFQSELPLSIFVLFFQNRELNGHVSHQFETIAWLGFYFYFLEFLSFFSTFHPHGGFFIHNMDVIFSYHNFHPFYNQTNVNECTSWSFVRHHT